jgi:hypothetical protein
MPVPTNLERDWLLVKGFLAYDGPKKWTFVSHNKKILFTTQFSKQPRCTQNMSYKEHSFFTVSS